MSEVPATPEISCPECGKLRLPLWTKPSSRSPGCKPNSTNSAAKSTATPPTPPRPLRPIRLGPPSRSSRRQPTPARWATRASRIAPSSIAARPGPGCRAVYAHDLHPMPAPLPQEPGPDDPEPTWHQVAEIPPLAAIVTEHQGHARTCPCCGHLNRSEIPAEIRADVTGPRLAAVMSYFSGRHHLSRRGVEEIVETVFEVPTSLGTVIALEARDDGRLGRGLSRGPEGSPAGGGEEHRRDRLERSGPEAMAVDGGDRDGGLVRDPPAAEFRGPSGPAGRDDQRASSAATAGRLTASCRWNSGRSVGPTSRATSRS